MRTSIRNATTPTTVPMIFKRLSAPQTPSRLLLAATLVGAFLLSIVSSAGGHLITLDTHQEECFHENLSQGSKIKFTFEVLDGGSLDVDLTIRDPSNTVIHTEHAKSSGRYTIEANQAGTHTYCFANKMSSMAAKILMFSIEHEQKKESEAEHDKLQDMVTELSALLTGVKHEMDFLSARDRLHRNLSEKVNSRVVMWSLFEFLLVIIVAVGQTAFLKRFFETRQKV